MTRIGDETVNSFDHGSKGSIGGTALVLIATTTPPTHLTKGAQIKAAADNDGTVYVGKSDVTADSAAATDGYPLSPGEALFVPVDDPSKIYVIGSGAGQKVFFLVV